MQEEGERLLLVVLAIELHDVAARLRIVVPELPGRLGELCHGPSIVNQRGPRQGGGLSSAKLPAIEVIEPHPSIKGAGPGHNVRPWRVHEADAQKRGVRGRVVGDVASRGLSEDELHGARARAAIDRRFGVYSLAAGVSVTVAPCVHLEAQPPHISATKPSRSAERIDNTRDPESSAGTNGAPHAPQGCSRWEGWCFRETVTLAIPPC